MEKELSIYDLKLHQSVNIGGGTIITRVPGGWIYDGEREVFVPYNDEFDNRPCEQRGELPSEVFNNNQSAAEES